MKNSNEMHDPEIYDNKVKLEAIHKDIKRLMETLNVAANNCLEVTRLYATFDKWYPSLETSLNELRAEPIDEASESLTNVHPDLLEELLEMS